MSIHGIVFRRVTAVSLFAVMSLAGCSAAAPPVAPTTSAPILVASSPSPAASSASGASISPATDLSTSVPPTPFPSASPIVSDPIASAPLGKGKQVLGFFLPGQMDYVLTRTDFSVLTTIAYFGISASDRGGLHRKVHGGAYDFRWKAWIGSKMSQIIQKAHAAGTKVVLTVTRFSWTAASYHTSVTMLSSEDNRARLAKETADEVIRRGVDGVNVDFEPIPASQRANFVDFVRKLRAALDARKHGLQLTVDTTGYIANYDVSGLTARGAADAIFIMAYHYSGSWSRRASAVSPLHRSSYDVTDTVDAFLRYTTPNKIMLGLPYYGNVWSTYTSELNSRTRPGSPSYGYPSSVVYSTASVLAAAHGRLWNNVEMVPWTRWQSRACSACPLTWRELYYEDAQSLKLKHDLVISRNLLGTGIWTLGFGGTGPELNRELRQSFGSH